MSEVTFLFKKMTSNEKMDGVKDETQGFVLS